VNVSCYRMQLYSIYIMFIFKVPTNLSRIFSVYVRVLRRAFSIRSLPKRYVLDSNDIEHLCRHIRVRNGLPLLRQVLSSRVCRIAYFGASVTQQQQGFRPYCHEQICKAFGQPHLEIKGGFGGFNAISSSYFFEDFILRKQPDLCFIDLSLSAAHGHIGRHGEILEILLRALLKQKCHVCLLHMFKSSLTSVIQAAQFEYEYMASYYGVPSIHVHNFLHEFFLEGVVSEQEIFRDNAHVHNNNRAGFFLGQVVFHGFQQLLATSAQTSVLSLPSSFYAIHGRKPILLPMCELFLKNASFTKGKFQSYTYYEIDLDNEIEFAIPGECEGILCVTGMDAGVIAVTHDHKTHEYSVWDRWCHYDRISVQMFGPFSEPFRLRLTNKPVDYTRCRRQLYNTDCIRKKLKIIGFLYRAVSYKGINVVETK